MARSNVAFLYLSATILLALLLLWSSPSTSSATYQQVHEHVVAPFQEWSSTGDGGIAGWGWGAGTSPRLEVEQEEVVEAEKEEKEGVRTSLGEAGQEDEELRTGAMAGDDAEMVEEQDGTAAEPALSSPESATAASSDEEQATDDAALDSGPQPFSSTDSSEDSEADSSEDSEADSLDSNSSPPPSSPATLPICERTLFFHIRGTRGFASEFNRLIKVAAIGEYYGYEVVLTQGTWMYGRYENYFTMPERKCSLEGLPGDKDFRSRPRIDDKLPEVDGKPEWTTHDHIQDGGTELEYTDALFMRISTDTAAITSLHRAEVEAYPAPLPLSGTDTVPETLWTSFEMQSVQARKWWRLNEETRAMVEALKAGLEWGVEGKERVIVGMHIRLGDKCVETVNTKYNPLRFASKEEIAHKRAKGPVCANLESSGGLDSTHAEIYLTAGNAAVASVPASPSHSLPPLLAIMSDDADVYSKISVAGADFEKNYDLLLLPDVAKGIPEALGMTGGKEMQKLDKGFSPIRFQELSLKSRIALTRRFIRDLTLLGEEADAFIFTGSSNVGRLGALIGGSEKARAGRYISCDSRWFGTAYYN